jgi:DNA-binding transcriptional MerR regulator
MGLRDRETFGLTIAFCGEPDMDGPKIRRLYYSAGEVCRIVGIKPHTLRSWEERFGLPKPTRNLNGRKLYRPGDLDATVRIKASKDAGMTDEAVLALMKKSDTAPGIEIMEPVSHAEPDRQWIDEIQAGLEEILFMVRN